MDDSVIKVLRRNGSWNDAPLKKARNESIISKANELSEFSLDENFGILAEEIKKRMKVRSASDTKYQNDYQDQSKREIEIKDSAKRELLPHLKEINNLVEKRQIYTSKIEEIDHKLGEVKNKIQSIKVNYENNIKNLQENINFFDQSINIINTIKGDKK